jgi:hypothetical protein
MSVSCVMLLNVPDSSRNKMALSGGQSTEGILGSCAISRHDRACAVVAKLAISDHSRVHVEDGSSNKTNMCVPI